MSFLKAEWRKLAIANYEIAPDILQPHLPYGTELDTWNNICFVSLVGFKFVNTRLLGFPIPFHRNFEEVNLRFYVRHKHKGEWKRGVVFIKEIVPRHAITLVANTIYKEHYQTMRMSHEWQQLKNHHTVWYGWEYSGKVNSFLVKADLEATDMTTGSETEFITEHYWGYTKVGAQNTMEYEVRHPKWQIYKVHEHEIDVDFETLYGEEFKDLTCAVPKSVMLAEGSEISVENKRKIEF
ncbi:DUF2071 domain-containing protein [Fulvivirga sp. 29W222]|uniref:DUF2071 domain-containing protein n=1 Tax=Fulvivirga marina TaxID=2494733 RepID=A0A937KBB9_9BACT|nr:DUF2071 domain-containing protein [Fulvivirga marina]MBL6445877.1 DUF2071 domain-containing protein [Fulvivirga marina]